MTPPLLSLFISFPISIYCITEVPPGFIQAQAPTAFGTVETHTGDRSYRKELTVS